LLQLADRKTVETVFMPEEGRDTICISSQVGCPVDCKFCLTALMGLERNLTAGEIVGQVLLVAAAHGLDPRDRQLNVVMMGQGEPLLNLANVIKATGCLRIPRASECRLAGLLFPLPALFPDGRKWDARRFGRSWLFR
jgi:23S rRNA (adenine2503-C2)-methyltransferase